MKRENFRRVPDNLLPKDIRNPEASFEAECGDLTRDEILAKKSGFTEEGVAEVVLRVAEEVIIDKENEEITAQKRAMDVALKVMEEAEKRKNKEK